MENAKKILEMLLTAMEILPLGSLGEPDSAAWFAVKMLAVAQLSEEEQPEFIKEWEEYLKKKTPVQNEPEKQSEENPMPKHKDRVTMKVAEFVKMELDIDVYDNVVEEIGIAFCGPLKLTAEGKRHFAEVLEYDIAVDEKNCCAVIDIDGPEGVWQKRLKKAKEFFFAAAGYCAETDWDKWFKED